MCGDAGCAASKASRFLAMQGRCVATQGKNVAGDHDAMVRLQPELLTSKGRVILTSKGRVILTSKGRVILASKGRVILTCIHASYNLVSSADHY